MAKFIQGVCATNDLYARLACEKNDVEIIGLIGILELNIKLGHFGFKEAQVILHKAVNEIGSYISKELIENFKEKFDR